MKLLIPLLDPDEWRRGIAMIILWSYTYQLIVWPLWFNLVVIVNAATGSSWPAPTLIPWEQLAAGTGTLGTVGGIQAWRERNQPSDTGTTGKL